MRWQHDSLFLGSVRVGSVYYNAIRPRGSELHYRYGCNLPSAYRETAAFKTADEAREALQAVVTNWLKSAGLPT